MKKQGHILKLGLGLSLWPLLTVRLTAGAPPRDLSGNVACLGTPWKQGGMYVAARSQSGPTRSRLPALPRGTPETLELHLVNFPVCVHSFEISLIVASYISRSIKQVGFVHLRFPGLCMIHDFCYNNVIMPYLLILSLKNAHATFV